MIQLMEILQLPLQGLLSGRHDAAVGAEDRVEVVVLDAAEALHHRAEVLVPPQVEDLGSDEQVAREQPAAVPLQKTRQVRRVAGRRDRDQAAARAYGNLVG